MTSPLLSTLKAVTNLFTLETALLEEAGEIASPDEEDCNEVMEDCGIWTYGEIPIDVSLQRAS